MSHNVYIKRTKINAPVEMVFSWHERDGAISRLTPPWAPLKMIGRSGDGIQKGVKVAFRLSVFKIPMIWEAEHIDYQENKLFKDRQIKGPFSKWEHTHRFIPDGKGSTIMEDKTLSETDGKGNCFISRVCRQWEDASFDAQKAGIRTVQLRIGVVLTPAGGALARMELPFKTGCGVRLSHGRQYMSWISMDDALSGILHILNHNKIKGPVNLVAPSPLTNQAFSNTLARIFSKKVFLTMPKFLALALWGEMGKETLLTSARVKPEKLLDNGFSFQHEALFFALKDMLGR